MTSYNSPRSYIQLINISMTNNYRHLYFNALKFPTIFLFLISFYFILIDIHTGLSILSGGLIFLGPHLWFYKVFFSRRNITMKKVVSALYKGTAGKYILAAVLFMGTFILFPTVDPYLIFGVFIMMNVVQLTLSLIMSKVIGSQNYE
jgi:F0F1-type ATP synthase assembly protein I